MSAKRRAIRFEDVFSVNPHQPWSESSRVGIK
jgi:hypothetical protein